jgi:hypothetical protein
MLEATVILLLHAAVALHYATTSVRGQVRVALFARRARTVLARVICLAAVLWAVWAWRAVESGSAAVLLAVTAMMVSGAAVTLLGPLAPRAVWLSAALAAAAVPVLSLLGASP